MKENIFYRTFSSWLTETELEILEQNLPENKDEELTKILEKLRCHV